MVNKTITILFVEGDTEVEFYDELIKSIPNRKNKFKIINIKGISKYSNRVIRIFNNSIKIKYPDYKYNIVLCYDSDVFELNCKPPVDWEHLIKRLKDNGADKVLLVKAIHSIEDWFLCDKEGIKKYLKLSKNANISKYKGQDGLCKVFRLANKVYVKGGRCEGFIKSLDIVLIKGKIEKEISDLIRVL